MFAFICWLSFAVIFFDMISPKLFRGDATLSKMELDCKARSEGYCDWEQYVYYTITLPLEA